MGALTDWVRAKVRTVSFCEIIDAYPTYNGRANIARITRARLSVSTTASGKPSSCLVSMQQDDGKWRERTGKLRFAMKVRDLKERYHVYVATTHLKYKGWQSSNKEMIGFFRVGPRGAVFLMANGDRIPIADPPSQWPTTEEGPSTHLRNLVVGPGGFLCDQHVPNPAYADHRAWLAEVSDVTAYLGALAARTGDRIDPADYHTDPKAICESCGKHAAQSEDGDAAWRLVSWGHFYCDVCNESRGK